MIVFTFKINGFRSLGGPTRSIPFGSQESQQSQEKRSQEGLKW